MEKATSKSDWKSTAKTIAILTVAFVTAGIITGWIQSYVMPKLSAAAKSATA